MKIFYLLLILISTFTYQSIAQQRVNETPAKCIKTGARLTKVKGYYKIPDIGQWVENQNAIHYKKAQTGTREWSLASQNFIFMQMCQIDSNYFILTKQGIHFGKDCPGKNKYVCCETITLIFSKEEIKELKSVCTGTTSSVTLNLNSFSIMQNGTEAFVEYPIAEGDRMLRLKTAIKNINEQNEMNDHSTLSIKSVKVNNQNVLRFSFDEQSFDEQYFECPNKDFSALLPN